MHPERLKEARERAGYFQKEVANALKCTTVTISRYESGARKPDEATLIWYAKNCGVSLDWLFGLTDDVTGGKSVLHKLPADTMMSAEEINAIFSAEQQRAIEAIQCRNRNKKNR